MPATSEKQKKFFGAVMGAKKGQKGVSGAAKKAAKDMSKTQIKHFLKTKEEDAQTPTKITQKDILAQVRKPMPPPQKTFDKSNKKLYKRGQKFKDYYYSD